VRAKHGGAIPGAIHQDWSEAQAPGGAMKSPLSCARNTKRSGSIQPPR